MAVEAISMGNHNCALKIEDDKPAPLEDESSGNDQTPDKQEEPKVQMAQSVSVGSDDDDEPLESDGGQSGMSLEKKGEMIEQIQQKNIQADQGVNVSQDEFDNLLSDVADEDGNIAVDDSDAAAEALGISDKAAFKAHLTSLDKDGDGNVSTTDLFQSYNVTNRKESNGMISHRDAKYATEQDYRGRVDREESGGGGESPVAPASAARSQSVAPAGSDGGDDRPASDVVKSGSFRVDTTHKDASKKEKNRTHEENIPDGMQVRSGVINNYGGGERLNSDSVDVPSIARSGDIEVVAVGASSNGHKSSPAEIKKALTDSGFSILEEKGNDDKYTVMAYRKNTGQKSIEIAGTGNDVSWHVATLDGNKFDLNAGKTSSKLSRHKDDEGDATFSINSVSGEELIFGSLFLDDTGYMRDGHGKRVTATNHGMGDGDGHSFYLSDGSSNKVNIRTLDGKDGNEEYVSVEAGFS